MANKLTQKQENFCKKYVECGNASEAYRFAYNAEKMKANSIHVNACKVLASANVSLRVKEIQKQSKEAFNITVEQKKKWLEEVINRSLQHEAVTDNEGNPIGEYKFSGGDVTRAINELNKMDGDHAAQKIEAKHVVETLSDDELFDEIANLTEQIGVTKASSTSH